MKKFILIPAVLLALYSPAWGTTVSDNFNRTDNTDVGTQWDANPGPCQILSNSVQPTIVDTLCLETWNARSFSGNQFAQLTITAFSGRTSQAAVALKSNPTGDSGYRCVARWGDGSAKTQIHKFVSGVLVDQILENTSGNWAMGDVLSCEARGTSPLIITVFKNGFPVLTMTDSKSPLSGTRIGFSCNASEALTDCSVDEFSGGDLSAGATCDLKADATGKFLTNQTGTPFFWLGDTAKDIRLLSDTDVDTYMSTRASQGFTVVSVVAIRGNPDEIASTAADVNGNLPLIYSDLTRPNPRYWKHLDYIIQSAANSGLRVALSPFWPGFSKATADPYTSLVNPWFAKHYGIFIGRRYRDFSHIVYLLGGDIVDADAREIAIWDALAKGIAEGVSGSEDYSKTCMSLHSGQEAAHSSSDLYHRKSWLTFNSIQWPGTHDLPYGQVITDLGLSGAKPTGMEEGDYEDFNGPNVATVRKGAWATVFAGGHYTFGNIDIWCFGRASCGTGGGWAAALSSAGGAQMIYLKNFMTAFSWQTLSVDQSIITSGATSGASMNIGVKTAAGDRVMVYMPVVATISVDMSKFIASSNVLARWYDPTTNSYSTIGNYTNSGTQSFNPGGSTDRVLVLTAGHPS